MRTPRTVNRSALVVIGLVLAAAALPASAQWKWRDANGQITASDRPPPKDVPEKDILARPTQPSVRRVVAPVAAAEPGAAQSAAEGSAPGAPAAAASAPRTPLEKEVDARRRAADAEAAAKAKATEARNAEIRAENCRKARAHITALESGQRMARVNDKGEREVLDDKARADEMRAAREVVTSDCR